MLIYFAALIETCCVNVASSHFAVAVIVLLIRKSQTADMWKLLTENGKRNPDKQNSKDLDDFNMNKKTFGQLIKEPRHQVDSI